jgi:hypothetical protein
VFTGGAHYEDMPLSVNDIIEDYLLAVLGG